MRNLTLKIILIMTLLLSLFEISSATQFLRKDGMIDKDFNDDIFFFGSNIKFDGKVNGDLFAFCYEMVQSDTISESFNGFAYSIQNLGAVGGSFRAWANLISCNAPVGRNMLIFCNKATVGPQAVIGQNADFYCAEIIFQGIINGNAKIRTGHAVISGVINGDLDFEGDSLILNPGCVIGGNLNYKSRKQASIAPGAQIKGDIDWEKLEKKEKAGPTTFIGRLGSALKWFISVKGFFLLTAIVSALVFVMALIKFPVWLSLIFLWMTMAICGNIFILITRGKAASVEKILRTRLLPSAGLGLVILFLTPLVSAGLLLTVLGAPLGVLMLMLFGVALFASLVYVSLSLGRLICGIFNPNAASTPGYLCFTIGMIILVALAFIPYIGYVISLVVLMAGLGAILQSYANLPEPGDH